MGSAWGADGTIVFATTSGLYRTDDKGAEPRLLAKPRAELGELLYAWPHLLPGGSALLFTIVPRGSIEGAQIAWLDLKTLETRVVLTGGASPRYTHTGHLVYAAGQRLWAVAFNAVAGTTSEQALSMQPGRYGYARVSPDGSRIALDVGGVNRDIWIWDVARESLTRV